MSIHGICILQYFYLAYKYLNEIVYVYVCWLCLICGHVGLASNMSFSSSFATLRQVEKGNMKCFNAVSQMRLGEGKKLK